MEFGNVGVRKIKVLQMIKEIDGWEEMKVLSSEERQKREEQKSELQKIMAPEDAFEGCSRSIYSGLLGRKGQ